MTKSVLRLAMTVLAVLAFWVPAQARGWDGQLNGLDGVIIVCANANKEKYAARICDDLIDYVETQFGAAKIRVVSLGSYSVHTGTEPKTPEDFKNPLKVTIFVRGAKSGGISAVNVKTRLSVVYRRAVEAGTQGAGRRGELVMWEKQVTGAGPRRGLARAITDVGRKNLASQLPGVIRAWPKPN